ncbi:hypothetical protein AWJ20_4756 [Sugiyamaella lignohabitans]|uniref:Fe2OG dioxygenase domain-containing protein n=1 Tax=Sugiyamaella lignohabitans TaxID=796027 RepID=A0A167E9L4_9ASCO|nr:uncharacterized protein AWJ20_4756 [Sugiyamaella lignohabitans]ANB13809.1 hypothetical protein AWJ20_4756 [Sugiyamaella lignohabitans]
MTFQVDPIKDAQYNIHPFTHVHETSDKTLDYVDLVAIDLSKYTDTPEGQESRRALAKQLHNALSTYGFFYVTGHGIEKERIDHLYSVAQSILELPDEIKYKHLAGALRSDDEDRSVSLGAERGGGFKPRQYWAMKNGVRDQIEHYNFLDLLHDKLMTEQNHPEIAKAYLEEVAEYYRLLHHTVLKKITVLCDIILEIPEGTIWEKNFKVVPEDRDASGSGFGRFMMYHGMSPEDEAKTDDTWLRGHSDSTAFTFITSQPMASLQIRDYYTGKWRYIPYLPNAFVVNIGDAMEFITGGYFKSTIHRVVKPPADQLYNRRLGLIYFSKPSAKSVIDPEAVNSPLLERLGYTKPEEWDRIEYAKWDDEKGRLFGRKDLNNTQTDEPLPVKLYGRYAERWHQASGPKVFT